MPLLGRKVYIPRTQDRTEKRAEGNFKVPITNEVCKNKDEYEKRLEFYRQPIWTCQCTGVTGLSYQEARRSEVSAREQLEYEFPVRFERMVLELVHHSTCPLDALVDDVQSHLMNNFQVGETVELKVQLKGKIIRGKILKITQSSADEWTAVSSPNVLLHTKIKEGSSPSSDKENHVEDGKQTGSKHCKKVASKNFRYTVRLCDEDKIISSIPGHELIHTGSQPSVDLVKLFIRANAIQTGSSSNAPWVVSDDLFTKFNLRNKFDDLSLSPYKTFYETPKVRKRSVEDGQSKNKSSKKRKLTDQFMSMGSPKMKQATLLDMSFKSKSPGASDQLDESDDANQMSSPEKVRMDHTYSSPIGKAQAKNSPRLSPKKPVTPKKPSLAAGKKSSAKAATKKAQKTAATSAKKVEKDSIKSKADRKKQGRKAAKEDKAKRKKLPRKKLSSTEDDIKLENSQESPSKGNKKTSKKKLTDHFKMLQDSTSSEEDFKITPKKTPIKQVKGKLTKPASKTGAKEKAKPRGAKEKNKEKKPVKKVSKQSATGTPKKASALSKKASKSPAKRAKATPKGTLKKLLGKSPKKDSPKTSPTKRATPKKTPQKKGKSSPEKTPRSKKSLKQMTLFDVSDKKAKTPTSQVRYKLATPQSPRQPLIVNNLIRAKKNNDKSLFNKLMAKAVKELNEKQIKNLKPEVKDELTAKYEEYKMKMKWKSMTTEQRKEVIAQRREERKKHREEERQKKMEEEKKMRLEQAKRFEDQDLKLKCLPTPKLVAMPEGLPNTLFGDIAMVVEFLNCYCGLLMPNDPYPITADCLTKALIGGSEGFAYLSRVLVIMLKTLLQDKIAEDYKELNMSLSQIPVNMHTASELLRLSLRQDDQEHDDGNSTNGSEDFVNDDDVPQELVELLETSEFFELEPDTKLQLLVFLCHRILATYAVQDFMDSKQKVAARLWRDKIQTLKEKNEKLKEEKQKLRQQREAERLQKEQELRLKAEATGATVNGEGSEVKQEDKTKEKKTRKKKESKEVKDEEGLGQEPCEETLDLASVVKRRRLLAAKTKAEREEQEKMEREKRIKGEEEYRRLRAQEIFEKKFEDGIQQAKLALRQVPIGTDRNHSRYWVFSTVTPGLFIEKGWVDSSISYNTRTDRKAHDTDSNDLVEKSFPKVGQNLWFQYESVKDLEAMTEAMDNQGIRESALYLEIRKRYQDISKMIILSRRSGPELRDSNGPKELLDSLQEDLVDIESHIRQGNLGGVMEADTWGERVRTATHIKDLGALIIESQGSVNTKFLQGIMAPSKAKVKPVEDVQDGNSEEGSDHEEAEADCAVPELVARWREAVETAPTVSRLHLLLGIYEACVRWEKSSKNAKCKICRRKGDDEKLLLCDECNQPFHLFCLRPALDIVPKGDWRCPACAPSTRRNARNRSYKGMDDSDQSEDSSDEEEEEEEESDSEEEEQEIMHDDLCTVCSEAGELVLCAECPHVYHKDCHDPPMRNFPRGRWVCNSCLNPSPSFLRKKRAKTRAEKAAVLKKKQRLAVKKRKAREAVAAAKAAAKKSKISFSCKIAEDLVSKMLRYRDSGPFHTKPDPSEAPDYEEIISSPVDLHMLKDRCNCDEYEEQQEFLDDVRLLFNNAKQYYKNDEHVTLQANKLEDFFVNLLKWNLPDAVEAFPAGSSHARGAKGARSGQSDDRSDHSYGRRSARHMSH